MNTASVDTTPIDLTVEIRCADGKSTEFYQNDEGRIRKVLQALASPRLLTQSQLAVASEHGATVIPVREIDMILARTSGAAPLTFPLIFPAGLLDITEASGGAAGDDCYEECFDGDSPVNPLVAQVEVHTLGGWMVNLRIMAPAGNLVHHHRHWFAHFMQLPVVAFRLQQGGIGLINPNNLTRVSAHPQPDGVPDAALPMELLRWTPARSKGPGRFAETIR
jgi:hypothetical protein